MKMFKFSLVYWIRAFFSVSLLLTPVSGTAGWVWSSSATNLSQSGNNGRVPRIVGNGSNKAISVWPRFNGTNWIIQASFYSAGQWQTNATDISTTGQDASLPQVAWYGNGSARVVWIQTGTQDVVKTSFYDATQSTPSWSSPQNVSNVARNANTPQIAIDSKGNTQVVYTEYNGSHWILQARSLSGDQWQPAQALSANGADAFYPQIAMAPDGSFNVAWTSSIGGGAASVLAIQSRDGVLGSIVRLSNNATDAKLPMLCVDENSTTSAVWMEVAGTSSSRIVTRQMVSNIWGPPLSISPANLLASIPSIVSIGSGNLVAAWVQQLSNGSAVLRTRLFQSAQWAPAKDFSASGNALLARLAGTANGEATLVWVSQSGTSTVTNGSYYGGTTWSIPQVLGKGGQNAVYPDVAMPAEQMAQVVWLGTDGTNDIVQALGGSYVPQVFNLTVNRTGKGRVTSTPGGIDCGSVCNASFTEGAPINLDAVPDSGQNFLGWSGACHGSGVCSLTLSANTSVGAKFFASADYAIQVVRPPNGQVTSQPAGILCGLGGKNCRFNFGKGAQVVLMATPKDGFDFLRWVGCANSDQATCSISVDQPLTKISAVFKAKPKFPLKVSKTRNGSIASSPKGLQCGNNKTACRALFVSGTTVVLTATPTQDHQFAGWGGACSGPNPTCQVNVGGKLDVYAEFK